MQNDDENNGAGFGTPIDPADLSRIRVSKILRSEKPRKEQEDAKWNLLHHKVRMLTEHQDNVFPIAYHSTRKVLMINCAWGEECWRVVSFRHKLPTKRKMQAANFQSKFYTPPTP